MHIQTISRIGFNFFIGFLVFMTSAFADVNCRTAIIGAGLAGLTTAYRLQQLGIEATVFEARNIPGGRTLTYYDGEDYEELGGKFLNDGGEARQIKSLIAELGLSVEVYDFPNTRSYYQNGQAYDCFALLDKAPLPTDENYRAFVVKAETSKNILEAMQWFLRDHPTLLHLFKIQFTNFEGSSPEFLGTSYVNLFWDFYKNIYEIGSKKKQNLTLMKSFKEEPAA